MPLVRKFVLMSFCVALAGSTVACGAEEETSRSAEDNPNAAAESAVGASEETKRELGVAEWRITQAEADGSFLVFGLDAAGATRAELAIRVESRGAGAGVITYDVKAPERFTLRYEVGPGLEKANLDELASAPSARAVILRAGKDLEQVGDLKTKQSLTPQSVRPLMGHGSSGGQLTTGGGQRLVTPNQCLLDKGGNGCTGQVIQTVAGVVGTGLCLVASGSTLGLATAACAAGGVATVGSVVSMVESGCRLRPCNGGS